MRVRAWPCLLHDLSRGGAGWRPSHPGRCSPLRLTQRRTLATPVTSKQHSLLRRDSPVSRLTRLGHCRLCEPAGHRLKAREEREKAAACMWLPSECQLCRCAPSHDERSGMLLLPYHHGALQRCRAARLCIATSLMVPSLFSFKIFC
ncbi:hypothetical protein E2C01_067589 [Portunus trituberculatus]|uniref:Uncharacterized protein n=1 Tax=Portunus trituberculatus TaxID=210409 RepID=A0A5B7HU61_PORTR|nr:hypothetical protein [Portunus trituberculatus]